MSKADGFAFLLDDRPECEENRLRGRLPSLADSLADQLPWFPASSPVMLCGDWGSGKTTLLHATERRLRAKDVPTAWFEAWRYEGEIPLLPALVRIVWKSTPEKYQKDEKAQKRCQNLWRTALAACVGMGSGLAGLMAGPMGVLAPVLMNGLLAAREEEQKQAEESAEAYEEDQTQKLWSNFKELVNTAFPEDEKPLIVLIDDLDRCNPMNAILLLDSIRMLVARGEEINCRFIVALDRSVLAQAVARKFADISEYEGNRYLEKVFPISFDLPRLDQAAIGEFVENLLERVDLKDLDSEREALSLALSDPLFSNPRLMKRCINRFLLFSRLERSESETAAQVEGEREQRRQITLVRWIAASESWPPLRRLLTRRGTEYWHQVQAHLSDSSARLPDAEAESLLRTQDLQLWLRREFLGGKGTQIAAYTEADERLRKWGL